MVVVRKPIKPFDDYKWRWAVLTPTEGLNAPPVYLGVLRVLRQFEGYKASHPDLYNAFKAVETDTNSSVKLARNSKRNLLRNSQQYWQALDLLNTTQGGIELTTFGRQVADRKVTPTEFALTVIKTLELPNHRVEKNIEDWKKIGLRIKPLELILSILSGLVEKFDHEHGYITPKELTKIVIPLSGERRSIQEHITAIIMYRNNELDISDWPNCAPEANDERMAREFLLFLDYYGFSRRVGSTSSNEQYYLGLLNATEVEYFIKIDNTEDTLSNFDVIQKTHIPANAERKKVLREVTQRPLQHKFRQNILSAYNGTCLVTGVTLPSVLEAAHIIPVSEDGSDTRDNGICLRSDIHLMFDTGHLRIETNGRLHLSKKASLMQNYGYLPGEIILPDFLSRDKIEWRWFYT